MNSLAMPQEDRGASVHDASAVRFENVVLRGELEGGSSKLSFIVPPRSFQILTGPANCGKTAILRLVCLADRPAAGRIWLFGRDSTTLGRGDVARFRRRIGLMFAEDRLIEHLSVFDNAALAPRIAGERRAQYAPRVAELLVWVGLGAKMEVLPLALSRGQRRRLAIARALANRPDLVLADEPTGGLDAEAGLRILRLLAQINDGGTAVLMATRDEELAAASGAPVLRWPANGWTLADQAEQSLAP